jgi:transposase
MACVYFLCVVLVKIKDFDISSEIKKVQAHIESQKNLPLETVALLQMLMTIITLMMNFFGANSKNSGTPPSQDPYRAKKTRVKTGKKPGAQKGHVGTTLEPVENPDEIVKLKINPSSLPKDRTFTELESQKRQEINVRITTSVTEYQAQVLQDNLGERYVAQFPKGIEARVQYGPSVRGLAVYLSNYQMLPFERMQDLFQHQMNLPISTGTLVNMNSAASNLLLQFEQIAKNNLVNSSLIYHDETGVNISGKTHWLHSASNDLWTLFRVHKKRGHEAMDSIGILPFFSGTVMHDNWASYFVYDCRHALCNAHHIRELTRAAEDDGQKWAAAMIKLLLEIKKEVDEIELKKLSPERIKARNMEYDLLLAEAELECPISLSDPIAEEAQKKKRGRKKKSKSRNLLERLRDRKAATLLFMEEKLVPFTNNQAERDLRMTKVQQKISGCFRSETGATDFCRIRSFISTCMKQSVEVASALNDLFLGKLPDFIQNTIPPTE